MTLAPLHSIEVRGIEGKPGEVPVICAVPGCIARSQQRHHLWPRSYLRGQPVEWVRLPDGRTIQNTTGLCVRHHDMVTGGPGGHRAVVVYAAEGVLLWCEEGERENGRGWEIVGPLYPQPSGAVQTQKEPEHKPDAADHGILLPGETCKHCGYTKPQKLPIRPKRPSRTWVISVPDDAELGAEVLSEWVDEFSSLLGLEDGASRLRRYHVLIAVFAWASQHKPEFIRDVIEAAS